MQWGLIAGGSIMLAEHNPRGSSEDVELFIEALRQLRAGAGQPSFRSMARIAHYSHTALSGAVSGGRLPSLELALAFVHACGGDEEDWRRRWQDVADRDRRPATAPERSADERAPAAPPRPAGRWLPLFRSVPRRVALISAVGLAVLVGSGITAAVVLADPPPPPADPAACDPVPAGDPRVDHYIDQLRDVTGPMCAGHVRSTGLRASGQLQIGDQPANYYVQRNPDGYVQTQVDAIATGSHGTWSAYWQENPPDNPAHPGCSWYLQRVNDAAIALSWRSSGWLCAVMPSASPEPGRPTASPGCNPLPSDHADLNIYIDWLRSTTQPACQAIPVRGRAGLQRQAGETTGDTVIDAQHAFYLVQRNADGYVELQLIGPTTRPGDQPAWSVYWQTNPPDDPARPGCAWYQERVEIQTRPTWQVNGWLCTGG
jgi:hypothetical protein